MKLLLIAGVFLTTCEITFASRILFLFPIHSKSHLIVVQGLSTTLAQQGHDVTVVSPFPLSKPMANYRDIKSPLTEATANMATGIMKNPGQSIFWSFPKLFDDVIEMSDLMLKMPEFKKLLDEESFDLVVIGMFMNNFLQGIGQHFKCPTIMLSVNAPFTPTNLITGNPLQISVISSGFLHLPQPMSFKDRVKNFLVYGVDLLFSGYYGQYIQKKYYDKQFSSDRYLPYEEAVKNISLVLLNSHFTQGNVYALVPAMIEVGGLQIKPTPDPLPQDLQQWLDGAEHGVIFFSLGSNAKTDFISNDRIEILLKIFSKLKQRVIMKWDSDTLEGKPDNVLIGKWLPQDDILAHKNVKLFISHCGLGGAVESKYHGVPIVAIPLLGDQEGNANTIISEGWAVKVEFETMSEKSLSEAIQEVLTNPKYSSTVQRISQLYRDRPMNARESAVYWVEYVIRHRGASHLQYPGVHLNFWQRTSLDVVGLLVLILFVSGKVMKCLGKCVLSKLFVSQTKTGKNKRE